MIRNFPRPPPVKREVVDFDTLFHMTNMKFYYEKVIFLDRKGLNKDSNVGLIQYMEVGRLDSL